MPILQNLAWNIVVRVSLVTTCIMHSVNGPIFGLCYFRPFHTFYSQIMLPRLKFTLIDTVMIYVQVL